MPIEVCDNIFSAPEGTLLMRTVLEEKVQREKEERNRQHEHGSALTDMVGIHIPLSGPPSAPRRPPAAKPASRPEPEAEDEIEDDPFGDSNAVDTPTIEREEPKWQVSAHLPFYLLGCSVLTIVSRRSV